MYIYIYINEYIYIYIGKYSHENKYLNMCTCTFEITSNRNAYKCTYMYIHIRIYMQIYMYGSDDIKVIGQSQQIFEKVSFIANEYSQFSSE